MKEDETSPKDNGDDTILKRKSPNKSDLLQKKECLLGIEPETTETKQKE
jgi:hypothetical protein